MGSANFAQPTFIDLFCGIGGTRLAFESAGCRCV
ncbi:DNA cytosine methyltransferase [Candidatus Binatus soli]